MNELMQAWSFDRTAPVADARLVQMARPVPVPGAGEMRVTVDVCGICRTDLHLIEGDLAPRSAGIVPGHQVVGRVMAPAPRGFLVGERVGIAWLRRTCGECSWCRRGAENLCPRAQFTGWDADGGLAEYAVVPTAYAYALPGGYSDAEVAPLLCAGIIGYRALRRANLPPGGRLGIYGFGSSAHITAQIAHAQGAEIFVMTRGGRNRGLARELGACYVGDADATPPTELDSAIVFAPAGELVPHALRAVQRGGTVALAGIYMSDIPTMPYSSLFLERDLRTVTSNTRRDGEELMRLASTIPLRLHTTTYPFGGALDALTDLATGRFAGSGIVRVCG